MRGATMRAAGFTNSFVSGDIMPSYARSELVSIDISPVEADIDARFRELYQKSLRRK